MSKIFYDHLLKLTKLEVVIKKSSSNAEEREELWRIVDETLHHKVFGSILSVLPKENHQEFISLLHNKPHDTALISYLNDKSGKDVEILIKESVNELEKEILSELKSVSNSITRNG